MKKYMFIIVLFLCTSVLAFGQELIFRGHSFDTTLDAFREAEGHEDNTRPVPEFVSFLDIILLYDSVSVAGHRATMEVGFFNDAIIMGAYEIKIGDWRNYSQRLVELVSIYNSLYQRLQGLYGIAIGHDRIDNLTHPISFLLQRQMEQQRTYSTEWEYGGGHIQLLLEYDGAASDTWSLVILYMSPFLYSQVQEMLQEQKESTEGL